MVENPLQSSVLQKTVKNFKHEQEEIQAKDQARVLGLPYAFLINYPAASDILHLLPEQPFLEARMMAYVRSGMIVRIATDQPPGAEVTEALSGWAAKENMRTELVYVSPASFQYLLKIRAERQSNQQLQSNDAVQPESAQPTIRSLAEYAAAAKGAATTNLLDTLLLGADALRASDVHLEPAEKVVFVRLRIDGVLHPAGQLTVGQYHGLVSRMKVLAGMKIDLKSGPQDGRFGFHLPGKQVDLRVASLPTIYGEGIVLRLLEQGQAFAKLSELGFRADIDQIVRAAISEPYGMILVTGPTGSGKTTTLYAILTELNTPERKIMTLEDPVEYRIEGLIQSQVEPDKEFTFASGLKGALRQDPDVIMVGEIRDLETAEIATNAALTGHLLLSTLHTNSAPASLARLLHLGVPAYLLAGAYNLILAQRLVRKVCPQCVQQRALSAAMTEAFKHFFPKQPLPKSIPQVKGCPYCGGTGYFGRVVIAEALQPNAELEELVLKQASIGALYEVALKHGMVPMEQDGFWKVYQGITTPEEIWRVTRE